MERQGGSYPPCRIYKPDTDAASEPGDQGGKKGEKNGKSVKDIQSLTLILAYISMLVPTAGGTITKNFGVQEDSRLIPQKYQPIQSAFLQTALFLRAHTGL